MQIQPISSTGNPQFKGWKVNGDRILRANNGELRNYAEHFHKLKKEELLEITKVKDFFGFKMEAESTDAFIKLQGAVREVLTNLWDWKDRITSIEERQASGKILTDSQKESLITCKSWVKEVEEKADNCLAIYYEEEEPIIVSTKPDETKTYEEVRHTSDDYISSDNIIDDLNITVYTSTHYD